MVPGMCLMYLICGFYILARQWDLVPSVFMSIFKEAFTGTAMAGGAVGVSIRHVLIIGMKRAAFSNEAGMGTAPLAHSDAKTDEPVSEGLVAMLGPFIDTIIVCTMTALIILTNQSHISNDASGILMTSQAFIPHFGKLAIPLMGVIIFFFSFSTLLGLSLIHI